MTRVHIQLPYGHDARRSAVDYERGLVPDKVAYGFHHAEDLYSDVTYSKDASEGKILSFVRRGLFKVLGFDLLHAWRNRKAIDRADIVWTMLETDYLGVIFIQMIRPWVKPTPVLAQSVWMFDTRYAPIPPVRWLHGILARRAAILLTHSKSYLPLMRERFPKVDSRVSFFGVSDDTFGPSIEGVDGRQGPIWIFAAGNDKTRDWDVLLAAFGNDERFHLVLVCGWLPDETKDRYRNVELVRNPSMSAFRELYSQADVVAVPMHENLYSGITVALEAAAMKRPILSTRTGGVTTYFAEEDVLFVPPGDPSAMRERLLGVSRAELQAVAERGREAFLREGYSTRAMVRRYAALTDTVLERIP